uniref:SGF29 C-terminal domain-containing protein n=1 Tax=Mucochytrium quahogii TaxID=96639 RepID=A0A7S2RBW1_9STRA
MSASQAEGYGPSGEGGGSVLEEYLDTLLIMPVEVRRYITLLRELDEKCQVELAQLKKRQREFISVASERTKTTKSPEHKEAILNSMRNKEFADIEILRKSLNQKIAEKKSISDQLFDMSEENLKRIRGDAKYLEELFHVKGDMPDMGLLPGREVAAFMEEDKVWILAKVVSYSVHDPDRVTVADVEDSTNNFVLPIPRVVVLPENETLGGAKGRLTTRGRKVYAIYPDTTSFYKGTLVSVPVKDISAVNANNLINQKAVIPPGVPVCGVQFDDDVDALTGLTPKHYIQAKFVFIAPNVNTF